MGCRAWNPLPSPWQLPSPAPGGPCRTALGLIHRHREQGAQDHTWGIGKVGKSRGAGKRAGHPCQVAHRGHHTVQ